MSDPLYRRDHAKWSEFAAHPHQREPPLPGYSSRMSHTQLHMRLRYKDEASFAAPFLEMFGSLCLSADRLSDALSERSDPSSHSPPGLTPHEIRRTRERVKKGIRAPH